jgi:hypothetical protein
VGTLSYAAPERAIGRADRRSDIYSLGATLFHALAGQPPFRGDAFELLRQHADTPPPLELLAGVPASVRDVVARCLEKDPDARYQSGTELAGALEAAAATLSGETEPTVAYIAPSEPEPQPAPPVASGPIDTSSAETVIAAAAQSAPAPDVTPAPAPAPQPAAAGGGAVPPAPAPAAAGGGKTPPWVLFAGGGVAIAAVVGALFLFGVIGGGDDDDGGNNGGSIFDFPTSTFDFSTDDPFFPSETDNGGFIGNGVGDTADNPIPAGEVGVVADRMSVSVLNTTVESTATEDVYTIEFDVVNAGTEELDVFFEPFYYMIGDNAKEYDEFESDCVEENRITGVLDFAGYAVGEVCFGVDPGDTNLVFYIELDDDRMFFALP